MWLAALTTGSALAANIVIDGQFADWAGKANIADPTGDAGPNRVDITGVYWATNPGDPTAYFMVDRSTTGNPDAYYRIGIDTNCNGNFNEAVDRVILITYDPNKTPNAGLAIINGVNTPIAARAGNWGEVRGSRVEVSASFAELGISANQSICFYVSSFQNANQMTTNTNPSDRAPNSGTITWVPVPSLDYWLIALIVVGMVLVIGRRRLFNGWRT